MKWRRIDCAARGKPRKPQFDSTLRVAEDFVLPDRAFPRTNRRRWQPAECVDRLRTRVFSRYVALAVFLDLLTVFGCDSKALPIAS
jgi:hypothetical protein